MITISEELKATIARCEKAKIYSTNQGIKRAQIKAQEMAIIAKRG